MVAGVLIGPSIGGFLAQAVGMENVFLITGAVLLLVTLLTIFLLKKILHRLKSMIYCRRKKSLRV